VNDYKFAETLGALFAILAIVVLLKMCSGIDMTEIGCGKFECTPEKGYDK
jgi:hypothetical protein